jgi:hypothetical protein
MTVGVYAIALRQMHPNNGFRLNHSIHAVSHWQLRVASER